MSYRDQLQEKRNKAWNEGKAILDRADRENREMTVDEARSYDRILDNMASLRENIERIDTEQRASDDTEQTLRSIMGGAGNANYRSSADRELDRQFRDAILRNNPAPIETAIPQMELRSGFQPGIERRSLVTGSGTGQTGTTFWTNLQRHLVDSSAILAAGATVIQTESGELLKYPKSTAFSSAGLIAEGTTIPASDPTIGSVTFGAYKFGFLVQVSTELANDAAFDLLGFLAVETGIAIGNGFGAYAINGTGTAQPGGALTGATLGNTGPTGTATSFGTQSTAGQGGDLLLDLTASLAEPYQRAQSAGFLMRNATLNAIRKLKDSTGQYVFKTDIIPGSGSAGTLLNRPVYLDINMPAMGANAKSVLFGDFSRYVVRQINGIRFERSNEFAFDKDLITFRGLARLDGELVDTSGALKYFQHSAT